MAPAVDRRERLARRLQLPVPPGGRILGSVFALAVGRHAGVLASDRLPADERHRESELPPSDAKHR